MTAIDFLIHVALPIVTFICGVCFGIHLMYKRYPELHLFVNKDTEIMEQIRRYRKLKEE